MFDREFEMFQGDVFNLKDLDKAIYGCEAIHISLSTENEGLCSKQDIQGRFTIWLF
mgnify:CR=1 FL=1